MSPRPAKRKHERRDKTRPSANPEFSLPDPSLYIQAHEADIVHGTQAQALALSLEAHHAESIGGGSGTRLILWNPPAGTNEESKQAEAVWLDRYDVRLLLDTLPPASSSTVEDGRVSPTGWSDLPSDAEDTFFLDPDEVEDYHREKRRRMIDQSREERLRALGAEDGQEEEGEERWGGSDEEPEDAQREFMHRTATHLLTSPNAAQLEMRILANHGADKRFAFLRGRWSRAWQTTKARIKLDLQAEKSKTIQEKEKKVGLGGLAGYGDSDASDTEDEEDGKGDVDQSDKKSATEPPTAITADEALKEARRARAKEWAERRRALKAKEEQ